MTTLFLALLPALDDVSPPIDATTVRALWLADFHPDRVQPSPGCFVFIPGSGPNELRNAARPSGIAHGVSCPRGGGNVLRASGHSSRLTPAMVLACSGLVRPPPHRPGQHLPGCRPPRPDQPHQQPAHLRHAQPDQPPFVLAPPAPRPAAREE